MADNEGRGKRQKKRTKRYDENSDDDSESKADDDADAKRRRRGVDATSPPSNNISPIAQHRPSAVDVSADNNAAVSSSPNRASAAQPSETEGKAEESASSDPIFCEVCGGEHGTDICPYCATCFARDEGCVKHENCKCNEKPAAVAVGVPPNNNATTIAIASTSTSTTITHASDSAVSVSSTSVLPSGNPSISTAASSISAISNRTVPKLCLEEEVVQHAHKLMGYLNLGKREADALTMETKNKSRNDRWFASKEKSSSGGDGGTVAEDASADNNTYIQRDSLIKLKCKRGTVETVEYYRVLSIFKKFYNKWYPASEDKILWTQDKTKLRTDVRVLARMMKRQGSGNTYREVSLTKEGDFGPKHVFRVEGLKEVLSVECDLADFSG